MYMQLQGTRSLPQLQAFFEVQEGTITPDKVAFTRLPQVNGGSCSVGCKLYFVFQAQPLTYCNHLREECKTLYQQSSISHIEIIFGFQWSFV